MIGHMTGRKNKGQGHGINFFDYGFYIIARSFKRHFPAWCESHSAEFSSFVLMYGAILLPFVTVYTALKDIPYVASRAYLGKMMDCMLFLIVIIEAVLSLNDKFLNKKYSDIDADFTNEKHHKIKRIEVAIFLTIGYMSQGILILLQVPFL